MNIKTKIQANRKNPRNRIANLPSLMSTTHNEFKNKEFYQDFYKGKPNAEK